MNALAVSFMVMLMTGGCLVQLDRFHPSTWWQSIRTSRATAFHYLGVMPAMLLNAPATDRDDLSGSGDHEEPLAEADRLELLDHHAAAGELGVAGGDRNHAEQDLRCVDADGLGHGVAPFR